MGETGCAFFEYRACDLIRAYVMRMVERLLFGLRQFVVLLPGIHKVICLGFCGLFGCPEFFDAQVRNFFLFRFDILTVIAINNTASS